MPEKNEEKFRITQKQAKKLWDKVFGTEYKIESMDYDRRRKGIEYTVFHKGDDTWTCDCQSFIFRSGTYKVRDIKEGKVYPITCKHIRFAMGKEGMKIR